MDSEPHLPPELEQEIFQLAAQGPESILNLLLVARRVHQWVEPYLYRVIQVKSSPRLSAFLRALRDKNSPFLAAGPRSVFFEAVPECTEALGQEILAKCPNISRIGLTASFGGVVALAALEKLQYLKYLAASLVRLFPLAEMDGRHRAFARITHFSILDNPRSTEEEDAIFAVIPDLPVLTHVCFLLLARRRSAQIRRLLQMCSRLEILLLCRFNAADVYAEGYPTAKEEPRIVWAVTRTAYETVWTDWLRGAYGLVDVWQLAEERVQARLRGEGDVEGESPEWIVEDWETWPTRLVAMLRVITLFALDLHLMSQPRLPPELEREIFEFAAEGDWKAVPRLLLVAHRVRDWTEPFLYRTIRVGESRHLTAFRRVLRTKPPAFLAASVCCVLFEADDECTDDLALEILQKCPRVTRIGKTRRVTNSKALAAFGALQHLQHLTVDLCELFAADEAKICESIDPRHPALAHITHLTLLHSMFNRLSVECICAAVPRIPMLTHLRIDYAGMSFATVEQILSTCPRLRVLLLTYHRKTNNIEGVALPVVSDKRLVWGVDTGSYGVFWTDWMRGAVGSVDMWALADACVEKRMQGTYSPEDNEWVAPSWTAWPSFSRLY